MSLRRLTAASTHPPGAAAVDGIARRLRGGEAPGPQATPLAPAGASLLARTVTPNQEPW